MAKAADHIEIANRNHTTLLYLLKDAESHLEWVVTVAFYKAVHIAEAVLHSRGRGHSTSHDNRLTSLKTSFGPIFVPFKHLYNASRVARYLVDLDGADYQTFSSFMNKDDVHRLIQKKLRLVEQNSLQYLDDDVKKKLIKIDLSGTPSRDVVQALPAADAIPAEPSEADKGE